MTEFFCVNCRHCKETKSGDTTVDRRCKNDILSPRDLVTGDRVYSACWVQRENPTTCGKLGKYYDPKSL